MQNLDRVKPDELRRIANMIDRPKLYRAVVDLESIIAGEEGFEAL